MNSDLPPKKQASGYPSTESKVPPVMGRTNQSIPVQYKSSAAPKPKLGPVMGTTNKAIPVQYSQQSVPKQPTPLSPMPVAMSPVAPSPQSSSNKVRLPAAGSTGDEEPVRKETSRVTLPLADQLKEKATDIPVRKETSRIPLPLADQLKEKGDDTPPPARTETARVKLPLSDQVRDEEESAPAVTPDPAPAESKLAENPVATKQQAALEPPTSIPRPVPQAPQPPSATSTLNKPVGESIAPVVPKQPPVAEAPSAEATPQASPEQAAEAAAETSEEAPAKPARLLSLDALRGFDMFWIIGGAALLRAIANWSGHEEFIKHATEQTKHSPWIGFTAYDLIFPLFIFISGVTIPYAITSKIANGTLSKPRAYFRVIRRFILLTALGLSFTFLSFDPEQFRIPGVLQLIAGGYLIAAIIAIHRPAKAQFIWALGLLVGYWLALAFIPIPGSEAGKLTPADNLAAYLDRLLPGQLYMGVFDPEGPIRYLPAAAMALLGAAAGSLLKSQEKANHGTFLKLLLAGLVAGGVGWAWGMVFPIIKPLWTSSYVLFSAGCSLILLSLFYLVIDVWKQRWLGFLWIPIGMNAITIYVLTQFVNFRTISENILGGYAGTLDDIPGEFTLALGVIVLEWILLFYLFRKKTFLRA